MKPRLLICFASIACVPFAIAAMEEESPALRVMVFNIAAGHGNLDRIIEEIRAARPDVAGLQEVDKHWSARSSWEDQAAKLGRELGMEVFFAPIYTLPHAGEDRPPREYGLAFLSRHPILEKTNHGITRHSTQRRDAEPEIKPGFPEIAIDFGHGKVRFFNTHLDYRADPTVRKQQVADMLEIIGDTRSPTILLGDLNATPEKEELKPLWRLFRDAWDEDRHGKGNTFPASAPDRRIDYLLVSDHFEVKRAKVTPTDASDHLPLIFDLVLRR